MIHSLIKQKIVPCYSNEQIHVHQSCTAYNTMLSRKKYVLKGRNEKIGTRETIERTFTLLQRQEYDAKYTVYNMLKRPNINEKQLVPG